MPLLMKVLEGICVFVTLIYMKECTNLLSGVDEDFYLVNEAYSMTESLFNQGKANYRAQKNKSLNSIDTFLDLVNMMNNEMAKELRSAVLKFYKTKYFNDFTNNMISLEEMQDIVDHCLIEPLEKSVQIRAQFQEVIMNFEDSRNFDAVDKCYKELPDEVAASHCILHQGVLLNESMHDNLINILEMKTRQHAQYMNQSIFNVHKCLYDFVPHFFEQLLLNAYTPDCEYLQIINASITDLMKDKWRSKKTIFFDKWKHVVRILRDEYKFSIPQKKEKLNDTIFTGNVTKSTEYT